MVYIVEKCDFFEMRVPFLQLCPCKKYVTSFLNDITYRVSAKYCFINKKPEFCIPCVSLSELA